MRRKGSKYGNKKTVCHGKTFDSKKEAERYSQLVLLERAEVITGLMTQPRYPLKVNGKLVCTYIADFEYYDNERKMRVIEDVKGYETDVFKLKKKLFEAIHAIELTLIK